MSITGALKGLAGRHSVRAPATIRSGTYAGLFAFLAFSLLLLSPNIVALLVLRSEPLDLLMAFANAAATRPVQVLGYSLAIWFVWVAVCGRVFLACALLAPLLLLVPIENYLLIEYHTRMLPHVFGVVQESDLIEAREFLRGLWWKAVLAYLALGAAAAVALRILWRTGLVWRHASRFGVIALFVGVALGTHLMFHHQEAWTRELKRASDDLTPEPHPLIVRVIRDGFPFGLVVRYADYRGALDRLEHVRGLMSNFRFRAREVSAYQGRETFVLVIGESARYDRWSINGYARPTSPRLTMEGNLISLTDVVSVASATRISVPILLSRKPAERALDFTFNERSLISAFREAGFRTYWLSNQAPLGSYETPVSVYAAEADERRYFNAADFSKATPYDAVMLPSLAEVLAKDESRQLVVVHTLGSHFSYRQRYPDQFDIFRPSPSPDAPVPYDDWTYRDVLNNAYDNSILYTDYFLSEVISQLKISGRPLTAMLYVSDHGEDLFDQQCRRAGHGRSTPAAHRIPMFFWYSDQYAARYPEKLEALRANRRVRLTTESVFPTFLDAAGIAFPTQDLTRSAMSRSLTERPRRVVSLAGLVDFDHARLNEKCDLTN
ncbi:MAG TPA: phosphoethanolamine transferase [Burkholderiales bacterium]|nr:phosphoethanolamine transferase [Burkholderiales bacterium]